ncbi:MAG: ATP-binding cassette domain-containing protein, partial [Microbacteriaceae bacterium]
IVLVEHDLDAAIGLADRAVVLDRLGEVVADGPVDLLRDRAEELLALGIWLPTATLAALRLRGAGVAFERQPLVAAELREALAAHPEPIAVAPGASRRTASARPLVVARDLRVSRRRTPVLHGVDLSIAAGSFTAIVGANGAGKTTLLQALCGVLRPPRGSVSIDGVDAGRADARLLGRRVGFVFQNPEHQFVTGTVLDEVAHELRRQGLEPDEVERRARATLRRFGLEHRAEAHPFLLSGGQKRRLSVAAALVAGAELLALDEPTFGQDRERAEELLALLSDLNAAGTTVLVVTHDLQLVAEHASDVIVLGEGRLLAHGPVGAVLADDALLERSGLRPPPLHAALRDVPGHPELAAVTRFAELPTSGGRGT